MDTVHQDSYPVCTDDAFDGIYKYNFKDNKKFMEGWRRVQKALSDEKLYDSLIKAQVFFYSREVGTVDYAEYQQWLKCNQLKIKDLEYLTSTLDSAQTESVTRKHQENAERSKQHKNGAISITGTETERIASTGNKCANQVDNSILKNGGDSSQTSAITKHINQVQDSTSSSANGDGAVDKVYANAGENSSNQIRTSGDSSSCDSTLDKAGKRPANFMELIEMIQSGLKLPDTEELNIEPLNQDPTPCDKSPPKKPWEMDR